jgi:hypothetical protein
MVKVPGIVLMPGRELQTVKIHLGTVRSVDVSSYTFGNSPGSLTYPGREADRAAGIIAAVLYRFQIMTRILTACVSAGPYTAACFICYVPGAGNDEIYVVNSICP